MMSFLRSRNYGIAVPCPSLVQNIVRRLTRISHSQKLFPGGTRSSAAGSRGGTELFDASVPGRHVSVVATVTGSPSSLIGGNRPDVASEVDRLIAAQGRAPDHAILSRNGVSVNPGAVHPGASASLEATLSGGQGRDWATVEHLLQSRSGAYHELYLDPSVL